MVGHASFDERVLQVIPSVFNMISSSADHQESEEAYNTGAFELPNPNGKAGGACTSAFLQQQYETGCEQSWVETLQSMRTVLKGMKYDQIPTLTSSRLIDPNGAPMQIVPPGSGRRRALLMGINYVGQQGELTACHSDCQNVLEYLLNVHGFREEECLVLMDDGVHDMPTKENIETAMCLLTKYSQPGDVCFVSFSGHGGQTLDLDGDEDDGYDETIIPLDFIENGQIVDDDILDMLVKPMRAGVHTTVLMDCCHSGTVMDLPYKFGATDRAMSREDGFNMEIITEAKRPKKVTQEDIKAAKARIKNQKREKEKEEQRRAEREARGRPPAADGDDEPVGPKLAPNGAPVLPTRPAPRARVEQPAVDEDDEDGKKKKRNRNKQRVEGAPPTPGKAWQFWKK